MKKIFTAIFLFFSLLSIINGQTTISGSFDFEGINRTYRLYVPASYNAAQPAPLLFNLHGYGSNNVEQELYGNFRPVSDTAGFIIIHPNGTVDQSGNRFWNTFGNASVNDLGFLSALIDTISNSYSIDPNRIYSTGMSNGGFMSYELACFLSHRITAIASVTGSMIWLKLKTCNPQHPTPVMQIHGTADATVPYNGNFLFAPVDTLVKFWVTYNQCNPVPQVIQIPDINPNDGCTAEQYIFSQGDHNSSVELFKVLGGGHSWPGAPININITNMDFSASEEIWRFLSQYNLSGLISGVDLKPVSGRAFLLYPNPGDGRLKMEFGNEHPERIFIHNSAGQLITSFEITDSTQEWHLHHKGLYTISVAYRNGEVVTRKYVVY